MEIIKNSSGQVTFLLDLVLVYFSLAKGCRKEVTRRNWKIPIANEEDWRGQLHWSIEIPQVFHKTLKKHRMTSKSSAES